MSNSEHLEILLKGVDTWNQWRLERKGVQPDLSGGHFDKEFCEKYFYGANLQGVNLEQANLEYVDFRGLNLSEIKLDQASLLNANLEGCNLDGASLKGTKFWNVNGFGTTFWDADLSGAVFSGSILCGANFNGANLYRANLEGTSLQNSSFWNADMRYANLHGADLEGGKLDEANLQGANLTRANLINSRLQGANLQGALLMDANIRSATLERANFVEVNVTGIKFNKKAKYRGIRISSCFGSPQFVRLAQDQNYIEEIKASEWDPFIKLRKKGYTRLKPIPTGKMAFWIWSISSDCGRSLLRWTLMAVFLSVIFGFIFYSLGEESFYIKEHPSGSLKWSLETMIYYSMAIFAKVSFGDIAPVTQTATRWVVLAGAIGLATLGGLITILADKIARRA